MAALTASAAARTSVMVSCAASDMVQTLSPPGDDTHSGCHLQPLKPGKFTPDVRSGCFCAHRRGAFPDPVPTGLRSGSRPSGSGGTGSASARAPARAAAAGRRTGVGGAHRRGPARVSLPVAEN
ncbi:hypothetical protein GCM10009759_50880 [Kitasatospora saccharophila]|uniref:Secreted protein n=1 Tax=Kitasatospora saccharophila TaxID=407973 RepID=A0ABN2XEY1_9ACTN